jgi:hypothetical protein
MISQYRFVIANGKSVHFYKQDGVWYFLCRHNITIPEYEAAVDYSRLKNKEQRTT